MANIVRNFQEGGHYHIYNRGNHRQPIFLSDFDYQYFLSLIFGNADEFDVSLIAYCLMRNHYHFLVQQVSPDNLSVTRFISNSTMSYVHYFNNRYDEVGRLFQGTFRSRCVKTDEDLYNLSRYIHSNPEIICKPNEYQWSSLQDYLSKNGPKIVNNQTIMQYLDGQPYELKGNLLSSEKVTF